ncbi:GtrA family protein [Paraburkholderia fungorum]|jgi:putative flippase GtrA|uniref:GtrA family protein n=1 Tax=Paraburkholderia fungorum TaxID=134537 RepID=UPI000DB2F300|nr:GtrA family protein [Paraburkholderia fungorum]PZR43059.1 MAG: GtrA family protein [Paraburkholderia fungorum]
MCSLISRAAPQVLRFLSAGGVNTAVTYLIYLGLIRITNYNVAYAVCYVAGIVLSYWLNLKYVFKTSGSLAKFILYPLVYLVQFLLGLLILNIFVRVLHLPKEYGPIAVVILTLPVTYLLSKVVLERVGADKDRASDGCGRLGS